MRQIEDCGVPCECSRCVSAYYQLQRIQHEKEQRDLRSLLETMSFTTRGVVMEYSYRDCLSEEIEILRLMLYRDEFLTLDPKACKHSGPLISKLEENMNELSCLDDKSTA